MTARLGSTSPASEADNLQTLKNNFERPALMCGPIAFQDARGSGFAKIPMPYAGFRDSSTYDIGAGYQLVDGLWIDASYGVRDTDPDTLDVEAIQAVLSYELGEQSRIDRRFRQDGVDDEQAGFVVFRFQERSSCKFRH